MPELLLGVRVALRSGGRDRARLVMCVLPVALAVLLLLLVMSVPQALDARVRRMADREPGDGRDNPAFWYTQVQDHWRGYTIQRVVVAVTGEPAVLPGVRRLPEPGQVVVSPALVSLMREDHTGELARRYGTVTGTIAPRGLGGPDELLAYVGVRSDQLDRAAGDVHPGRGGGGASRAAKWSEDPFGPGAVRYVLSVAALLVAMLVVLLGTCARLSATARDRRIAAVRLAGASAVQARKVVAGEAFAAAVIGTVLGIACYAVLRPLPGQMGLGGWRWYPDDFHPGVYGPLIVAGVPALSVLVATVAARRAIGSPLATRRAAATGLAGRRRLVPFLLGALLLVPAMVPRGSDALPLDEYVNLVALAGVVLLALSFPLVLPLVTRAVARLLGRGDRAALRLGARHLEHEPTTATRVVAGLGLADLALGMFQSYGLVLVTTFGSDHADFAPEHRVARVEGVPDAWRLGQVEGVRSVTPIVRLDLRFPEADQHAQAAVTDCRAAAVLLGVDAGRCRRSPAFIAGAYAGEDIEPCDPTAAPGRRRGCARPPLPPRPPHR